MQAPLKIGVLGFGNVGKSILQLLLADDDSRYVIEVHDKRDDAKGAFLDLSHSSMTTKRHQMHWVPKLSEDLDFIFHSAGAPVKKGDDRMSVAQKSYDINVEIFKDYRPKEDCKIIVIANPVDVVSRAVAQLSGLPARNVIGTGTYIDLVRFEFYLSYYFDVHPSSVEGMVLGEHGESQVPILSNTFIENKRFVNATNKGKVRQAIERTIGAAQEIKETQDATFYGVAACAFHLLKMFLVDDPDHIVLGVRVDDHYRDLLSCDENLFLSLPVTITKGEYQINDEVLLNEEELSDLKNSAVKLQQCWESLTHIN